MLRSAALAALSAGTVLAALLAHPAAAHACSCVPPPPPLTALEQASAVFEARVARVETDTARLRTTAHLIVIRQWKGDLPEDVTVTSASQGSLCGFTFTPDQRVLLYADGGPTEMSVSLCSRSRPMEQAGEDIAALLDLPTQGPRGAAGNPGNAGGGSNPGGGSNAGGGGGRQTTTPPAPQSGGCGGCGGSSLAGMSIAFASVVCGRRRRIR
jgi:hypothetical protein